MPGDTGVVRPVRRMGPSSSVCIEFMLETEVLDTGKVKPFTVWLYGC